jgi:hypothetical protein
LAFLGIPIFAILSKVKMHKDDIDPKLDYEARALVRFKLVTRCFVQANIPFERKTLFSSIPTLFSDIGIYSFIYIHTSDISRSILGLHKYISISRKEEIKTFQPLSYIQRKKKLQVKQLIAIVYHIVKFGDLLHDNNLILKTISEDDILVQTQMTQQV